MDKIIRQDMEQKIGQNKIRRKMYKNSDKISYKKSDKFNKKLDKQAEK